jgi:hypothetical protein
LDISGALEPVPPAQYQVTLGYEPVMPVRCGNIAPDPSGDITCPMMLPDWLPAGQNAQAMCSAANKVVVPVSLPATGDVEVQAAIQ